MRVRRAGADLPVGRERRAPVRAERAPELRVVVREAVRVARTASPEIRSRVVPDDREVAGRRVERDLRQELAVRGRVVVDADACAPGGAAVVRVADHHVGVVALVLHLKRVDEIDPPGMRAAGPVPGEPRLGVDGAVGLRRDEVEAADVRGRGENSVAEAERAEPVRVDAREELAAALAALGERADLHHLAARADRDVAVGAVVRARDDLAGEEGADLPEPGDGRAGREHRPAGVDDHPHLSLRRRDRRLVDEAEEAAVDVRDHVEAEAAVDAERDRDGVLGLVEVGQEEVAVLVEREARVAARVAEVVVDADQPLRPRRAPVEADRGEHARRQPDLLVADVRHDDDVVRVRRIDGDRLLRLLARPLADVDVRRRADDGPGGPDAARPRREQRCRSDKRGDEKRALHVLPFPRGRDCRGG